MKKKSVDTERLKFWKKTTTGAKLDWLQSALEFARAPKKILKKK